MRTLSRTLIAPALAAVLLLTGCGAGSEPSKTTPTGGATDKATTAPVLTTPKVTDDLLFVAKATSGKLSLDAEGDGTLTMTSVPTMTWFSDRPRHDAGTTSTREAFKAFGWKKNGDELGKGDMAPNAALTGDGLRETVVVELLDATLAGDDLTFTVAGVTKVPADQRRVDLGRTELFIDSVQPLADGPVVSKINGGVFNGVMGLTVFEGDVVRTADGKQAVNLTARPFWRDPARRSSSTEKMLFTLTEDSPYVSSREQSFPFVTQVIAGVTFLPAGAGRPIAGIRVYAAGSPGYQDVGPNGVAGCGGVGCQFR